ncbi:MAG: histidine kinase [Desulfovibrio sp. S3730MH75]|nr:MAG: histidine kinase [Desulfovibrio sp. S3730MH75]
MFESLLGEDHCDCIGILGNSIVITSLIQLLKDSKRDVEDINLIAGVLVDGNGWSSPDFEIPIYEQVEDMLGAHPEITMVFELSGDCSRVSKLRRTLPTSITLVELPAARFFLKLHATDRLWIACKVDLMQTQALFKCVVDQLPEDILIIGSNGMIMDCNKHFSDLVGEDVKDIRCKNPLVYYESLATVCPIKGGVVDVEAMLPGKREEFLLSEADSEGKMRFFRIYIYPISDEQTGNVVQIVVMRRNITNRTLMEQRLRQSERMATVGELAAYVAHEIRNPLVAMGGFAKVLMKNKSIDHDGHQKVEIIFEEANRLDKLLKSILNFVRSQDIEIVGFDVNKEVEGSLKLLSHECEKKCVKIELELDPRNPVGQGVPEQVKQCLINLVMNSMEAMADGGSIKVSTGVEGGRVWLKVSDDGPGIPSEMRVRVFDPFYSTKVNGNGLGLPMVKKIMEDFGGDIELVSREGEGTSVSLLLPTAMAVA